MHILHTHAQPFVTTEAIVENLFHAHATAAVIAHLAHNLRSKSSLQEQPAVTQVVARIAHAFGKHNAITVHNRTAFCIQILRMRHHGLCIYLVKIAVHHLDIKRLEYQNDNRAKHKTLQYKQGICAVFIHSTPPLS